VYKVCILIANCISFSLEKESGKGGCDVGLNGEAYNPWPGYRYTGKLRVHQVTPKRLVPPTIPRPDYAENDEGRPHSELALRGTSSIKILTDEEIEGMRVACKV
jgi:methionyl aminopeptidase